MAHALLSASDSKRWINCPSAARATQGMSDKKTSYAEEGTLAHNISEILLKKASGQLSARTATSKLNAAKKSEHYVDEMLDYCNTYVSYVQEVMSRHTSTPELFVEQRLDYSQYAAEGFGTGDALIISDGRIDVIDLKYGKGVSVEVEGNTQLMLYGLGAIDYSECIYSVDSVHMHIVQPRLDAVSEAVLSVTELRAWGDATVKPAAELAFAGGNGIYKSGVHCKWCKIKATCKQRALDMAVDTTRDFNTLSVGELAAIYAKSKQIETYLSEVGTHLLEQALSGTKVPGYKLVRANKRRALKDVDAFVLACMDNGYNKTVLMESKLKGLTELGKAVGKQLVDAHTYVPEGEPTLAPESDKRPELVLSGVDEEFEVLS